VAKNIATSKPQSAAQREPSDWKSWLSIVIATLAAIFTGGLWWETHQDVTTKPLLVRPSVYFTLQDDDGDKRIGLTVGNSGPGIAVMKSVVYYVDRKPMADGDVALSAGQLDPKHDHGTDLEPDDSMGVGETVWLLEYRAKDKKERERFLDFINDHLAVKVRYCSIAGDQCQDKCSTKGWCD
jgi:hypothetical protein